jgi:hypothetical protein
MLHVNYLRPEQLSHHQRDFPRREQTELPDYSSSRGLALLVACYLIAMFSGILLLGHLTAPTLPSAAIAEASATLRK